MSEAFEIEELWRYPVKSMRGERVETAMLRPGGIEGDRRWALRNTETGKIISAKRPRPYKLLLEWSSALEGGVAVVTSPTDDVYQAGEAGLDEALSDQLGEPVQVVEVVEGAEETYDSEWPEIPGTTLSNTEAEFPVAMMTESVSFVDLAAIHLIVTDCLDDLRSLAGGATVGVERFRPNMVLRPASGAGAAGRFQDLAWKDVSATVGDAVLWIADAAPRCVMTTLAQGEYEQAKNLLRVLAQHGRKESDFGVYACFGTYAEVRTTGAVRVGDRLVLDV